jgi:hypothetical protein
MVEMLVADKDGIHACNGSYLIAYSSVGRVYENSSPLGRGKEETGMAQPLELGSGSWVHGGSGKSEKNSPHVEGAYMDGY